MSRINVIDLFAGPGGLGEGFSAYRPSLLGKTGRDRIFKVRFSIEMDAHAHRTLLIRSFLRQFEDDYPPQYYEHYRGNLSFDEFRAIPELQDAWRAASEEVGHRPLKMGKEQDDRVIEKRISELMSATNANERWIVIGGPPCQAFSSVGRVRNMAKPDYRQSNDERIYAYIEYLKILDQVRPDCFILENVEGMLHTAPDGERIFPTIHRQLHDPSAALVDLGKKPQRSKKKRHSEAYKIISATGIEPDSSGGQEYLVPIVDYGVPQDRRRVILIGIRSDFVQDPNTRELPRLAKFVNRSGDLAKVSVGEAIGDLPPIRSKISLRNFFGEKIKKGSRKGGRRLNQIDCYMNGFLANRAEEGGRLRAAAVESMDGLLEVPRADRIRGSSRAERLIRNKYPVYRDSLRRIRKSRQLPTKSMSLWLRLLRESMKLVNAWEKGLISVARMVDEASRLDVSTGAFAEAVKEFDGPAHLTQWLIDPNLNGVRNHESREHKASDLLRYLYFASHAETAEDSRSNPNMQSIPMFLKPDHANVDSGDFSDRFRVQLKDQPAKTITCHLSKDGHAFIHYDAAQCRGLTVREAARLQTFPDNYLFAGPPSQQRKQVGNAVPPWFAVQLAGLIHELISSAPAEKRDRPS